MVLTLLLSSLLSLVVLFLPLLLLTLQKPLSVLDGQIPSLSPGDVLQISGDVEQLFQQDLRLVIRT